MLSAKSLRKRGFAGDQAGSSLLPGVDIEHCQPALLAGSDSYAQPFQLPVKEHAVVAQQWKLAALRGIGAKHPGKKLLKF